MHFIKYHLLIILFGVASTACYAQNEGTSLEYQVINDTFLEVVGEGRGFIGLPSPLMPDKYLVEYAVNSKAHLAELNSLDSLYYPFPFSELLIKTKGEADKLDEFRKLSNSYIDSLAVYKTDNYDLVFYVDDTLIPFNSRQFNRYKYAVPDEYIIDSLRDASFSLSSITKKGNFTLSTDKYPGVTERMATNTVEELGKIYFSKVAFNAKKNKAVFFFEYYKGPENAYCYLLYAEKQDQGWKIIDRSIIWVS